MSSFFLQPASKRAKRAKRNQKPSSASQQESKKGKGDLLKLKTKSLKSSNHRGPLVPGKSANRHKDEEIDSDASDIDGSDCEGGADIDSGVDNEQHSVTFEDDAHQYKETAEEKRLRLAKSYLAEIEKEERERISNLPTSLIVESTAVEEDPTKSSKNVHSDITSRIQREQLDKSGKLKVNIAESVANCWMLRKTDHETYRDHTVHKKSITCICISSDCRSVFTASKDCGIVKWTTVSGGNTPDNAPIVILSKSCRMKRGQKVEKSASCVISPRMHEQSTPTNHKCTINALAISTDSHVLASGGDDKLIMIWNLVTDPTKMTQIGVLTGHKGSVTGLAFRRYSHILFSCSDDRTVKVWNASSTSCAYRETLFGHEDSINAIDAGVAEKCVTGGGLGPQGVSVRMWKIVEQSQLVFNVNAKVSHVECVSLINDSHFLTAGQDGHLSLWETSKKKPLHTLFNIHGFFREGSCQESNWVSALCCAPNSDLLATGSCDGVIRLWKLVNDFKKIEKLAVGVQGDDAVVDGEMIREDVVFKAPGWVNSLAFSADYKLLVAGIGREHRRGRWFTTKSHTEEEDVKNCVMVFKLSEKR